MNKVFIAGSRKLGKLNDLVRTRLDNIVQNNYTVLVGDANGVDKAVQNYMTSKNYNNVFVYHVGNHYRNNLGQWKTIQVEEPSKTKNFKYYATKDLQMAKDTDYGLMIWDLESKGTLNNMINLLKLNKAVIVYISTKKEFYQLKSFGDLQKLLNSIGNDNSKQLATDLNAINNNIKKQKEFNFV